MLEKLLGDRPRHGATRGRSIIPVQPTPLPPDPKIEEQRRAGVVIDAGSGGSVSWDEAEARREAIDRALEGARAALAAMDVELEQADRAHRAADAEAVISGEAPPARDAVAALEARRAILKKRVLGIEEKRAAFHPQWLESAISEIDRQDAHDGREIAQAQARADVIESEIAAHQSRRNAELAALEKASSRRSARQARRLELTRELVGLRRATTV